LQRMLQSAAKRAVACVAFEREFDRMGATKLAGLYNAKGEGFIR